MAYVAYHFHWSKDEILDLTHRERHRWVEEISKINKKINKTSGASGGGGSSSFGPPRGTLPVGDLGSAPISGFNLTQPDDDD